MTQRAGTIEFKSHFDQEQLSQGADNIELQVRSFSFVVCLVYCRVARSCFVNNAHLFVGARAQARPSVLCVLRAAVVSDLGLHAGMLFSITCCILLMLILFVVSCC